MTKSAVVKGMLNRLFGKGNNDRPKSFSARATILPNGKPTDIEMTAEEHQRLLDCLPDHPIDVGLGAETGDAISGYAQADAANSRLISDSIAAYVHTKGSSGHYADTDDALVVSNSRLKELLKANPSVGSESKTDDSIVITPLGRIMPLQVNMRSLSDEQLHIYEGKQPPDLDGDQLTFIPDLPRGLSSDYDGFTGSDSTISPRTLVSFGEDLKPELRELTILEGQSARPPFVPRRQPYIKWNIDAKNGLSRKDRRVLRRLSKKAGGRVVAAQFMYNSQYPRDPRSTHTAICLLSNGLRVSVKDVPYKTMMDYIDTYVPLYRPQAWSPEEYYHSLTERGTI